MLKLAEAAVMLAIVSRPQAFDLTAADVNPLLMYLQHALEQSDADEKDAAEEWKHYFDLAFIALQRKSAELLQETEPPEPQTKTSASVVEPRKGSNRTGRRHTERSPKQAEAKAETAASRSNEDVETAPASMLTVKQLRYLGYLTRQVGEVPDYSVISVMSQKEATMRIKELEAKLKG